MKKQVLITGLLLSLCALGCTQDETLELTNNDDSIGCEIDKIEKIIANGLEKDESQISDEGDKIETNMSYDDRLVYYDYIKRNGTDKPRPFIGARGYDVQLDKSSFGLVLKRKGVKCAPYRELIFRMDCEDHNGASYVSGNTGDTNIDSHGNVNFFFCVVPKESAGYGLYKYDRAYVRFFDCEDSSTDNRFYINGMQIPNGYVNETGWGIEEDSNGNIRFYFNLSGRRAVGSFGHSSNTALNGIIYTDDEDNNNRNWYEAPIPEIPDNHKSTFFERCDNNTAIKVNF